MINTLSSKRIDNYAKLLLLQIENGDAGDTEELLETEETDPGREKGDKTKKKKYLGRINYKVICSFRPQTDQTDPDIEDTTPIISYGRSELP